MGDSYPKRGDREYIQNKAELTFTTRNMPQKSWWMKLFDIVNDRNKVIRVCWLPPKAPSVRTLADEITSITAPTLLIWGNNDTITPPL